MKPPNIVDGFFIFYAPTHDVAPSAVSIADAIDAISCTMNFAVSFLVIVYLLSSVLVHATVVVVYAGAASSAIAALA